MKLSNSFATKRLVLEIDYQSQDTFMNFKIPTEVSEITWDWVRVVLNQYRLTFCDKPAVSRESIIDVSIFDCKKSVGDFSSTYQVTNAILLIHMYSYKLYLKIKFYYSIVNIFSYNLIEYSRLM